MAAAAILVAASTAAAQPAGPQVGYVCPAGGRQGTTFEVSLGGQYLTGVSGAHVSGDGVQAKVIEHIKPISQKEGNELRMKLRELVKKRQDPQAVKEVAEIRAKLATLVRKMSAPALAEVVRLEVTVASDAAPGERELRLESRMGLSNPLVFCVGQLPEFTEKTTPTLEDLARLASRPGRSAVWANPPRPPVDVELPIVLNGQAMPGRTDRFRFEARQGQRLVFAAAARGLIPYIADAVPGWFQAVLALYDENGKEVAYDDDFRFHPDPVLCYEVPRDGRYVLEIRDSIYRGRDDFVYRITAGQVPYVTGVFPLGAKAGTQTVVEPVGWNLPVSTLTFDATDKAPGLYSLCCRKGPCVSNAVPFAVDDLPECAEQDAASRPGGQRVALPIIVNGRIAQPGESDAYQFDGHAGEEVVAEVSARRLGSPLDSALQLTDAGGKELAFNDDHEDKGSGLNTHHADSYLRVRLPADGTYQVRVSDIQRQGGPPCAYRLRISHPRPDFALRVVPSGLSVRSGMNAPMTVHVLRKDGFAGAVELSLKGAPAGFGLDGAVVPAGVDQVRFTLAAPVTPSKKPMPLSLQGRAMIDGRQVVRPAVPAEDMMQAFAYRHLVPSQELAVVVAGRGPSRSGAGKILSATPVRIPAGKTARVQVALPTSTPLGTMELELDDPPDGITIQEVSPLRGGASEFVLHADAAKAKPGLKGNLIVNIFLAPRKAAATPAKKPQANRRRTSLGTLSAIPFEIVQP